MAPTLGVRLGWGTWRAEESESCQGAGAGAALMFLPAAPSARSLLPSAKSLASTSHWALGLRSPPPLFLWGTLSSRLNQRDWQSEP